MKKRLNPKIMDKDIYNKDNDSLYKKRRIFSKVLKCCSLIIILFFMWNVYDLVLWKPAKSDFDVYMRTFLPILTIGFSGSLYGIALLLDNNE